MKALFPLFVSISSQRECQASVKSFHISHYFTHLSCFHCFVAVQFYSLKTSSVSKMVRRLNAEELHRVAAQNGFVAGAHEEEDEILQSRDPFTDRYLRNQQESLELWTMSVFHVGTL